MADVTTAESRQESTKNEETVPTIREEPVIIPDEPELIQEELVEPVKTAEDEAVPKRKPGRPTGSKSKEPGKPRKPRVKKVEIREELVENIPPQEELPRAIPGSQPIPEEAYDVRTAKMLRLLQMQSDHRKQQKRNVYSSWFR